MRSDVETESRDVVGGVLLAWKGASMISSIKTVQYFAWCKEVARIVSRVQEGNEFGT